MTPIRPHTQLRIARSRLESTIEAHDLAIQLALEAHTDAKLIAYMTDILEGLACLVDDIYSVQNQLSKTPPADPDVLARPMLDATKPPVEP